MTVLNLQVNTSGNDSETTLGSFAFSSTTTFSWIGNYGGQTQEFYTLFSNVTVPQGTVATSAILSLYNSGYSNASFVLRIKTKAEDADNPSAPTSGSDVNGRTYTSGTNWPNLTDIVNPSWQTIDVVNDCNTVFARSGFASGNNLGLRCFDNGSDTWGLIKALTYDGDTTKAAKLDITYGGSSGPTNVTRQIFLPYLRSKQAELFNSFIRPIRFIFTLFKKNQILCPSLSH